MQKPFEHHLTAFPSYSFTPFPNQYGALQIHNRNVMSGHATCHPFQHESMPRSLLWRSKNSCLFLEGCGVLQPGQMGCEDRGRSHGESCHQPAGWGMKPRMSLNTAAAVKAMESERLDPGAQMKALNADALTSLLIKVMLFTSLTNAHIIRTLMNYRVVHEPKMDWIVI